MHVNNINRYNQAFGVKIMPKAAGFIDKETKKRNGIFYQNPQAKMIIENEEPKCAELTNMRLVEGKATLHEIYQSVLPGEDYSTYYYPAGINYTMKYKTPWGKSVSVNNENLWHDKELYYKYSYPGGNSDLDDAVRFKRKMNEWRTVRVNDGRLKLGISESCDKLCREVMLRGAKNGELYKKENIEQVKRDFPKSFQNLNSASSFFNSFLGNLMNISAKKGHLSKENIKILKEYFPNKAANIDDYYTTIISNQNYKTFKTNMLKSVKSGTLEEDIKQIKKNFPENFYHNFSGDFLNEFILISTEKNQLSKNMEILKKMMEKNSHLCIPDDALLREIMADLAKKGNLSENVETLKKYTPFLIDVDDIFDTYKKIDANNKANENSIFGRLRKMFKF